jgi:hypothetical protein
VHGSEAVPSATEAWRLFESRLSPLLRTGRIFIFAVSRLTTGSAADRLGVQIATHCAALELDVLVLSSPLGALPLAIRQGLESMSLLAATLQRLELIAATSPWDPRSAEAARALLLNEDRLEVSDAGAASLVEAIRLVREGSPRRPVKAAIVVQSGPPGNGTIPASH